MDDIGRTAGKASRLQESQAAEPCNSAVHGFTTDQHPGLLENRCLGHVCLGCPIRRCAWSPRWQSQHWMPTQCPVPARGSRRVVPIATFIDHNFSIPHDFCTHGSPHNLLGATPPNRYVCVEPRQRAELYVHGHIFGPKTRQSILRREIEAITIQTGADQPLQPTIVALTSRGEKMESGNCCWLGFRVFIFIFCLRLPVVRQVRR